MPNTLPVEIRRMRIDELHPAEYNPRKISDEAFRGLSGSMDRFGILANIIWNKRTGNIVGGHQRYRHLVESGEEYADVVVVDLDDNEEVALNITLNNPHVRGDFTTEIMQQLRDCEEENSDFSEIGLDSLYEDLKKMGFEKKEKKEKAKAEEPSENTEETADAPAEEEKKEDDGKPKTFACITCPECGSKWKMEDNTVIFNGIVEQREVSDFSETFETETEEEAFRRLQEKGARSHKNKKLVDGMRKAVTDATVS